VLGLYFFHLDHGSGFLADEDGRDGLSLESAKEAAVLDARSIMADEVKQGMLNLDQAIDVADSEGITLHRLSFSDALAIQRPEGYV